MASAMSGGKGKKKKMSKGKSNEKAANAVLFNEEVYAKLNKEAPKFKLITTSVISDRLKMDGSVVRMVSQHRAHAIYTRATNA